VFCADVARAPMFCANTGRALVFCADVARALWLWQPLSLWRGVAVQARAGPPGTVDVHALVILARAAVSTGCWLDLTEPGLYRRGRVLPWH